MATIATLASNNIDANPTQTTTTATAANTTAGQVLTREGEKQQRTGILKSSTFRPSSEAERKQDDLALTSYDEDYQRAKS
jgi:hypothetical protein